MPQRIVLDRPLTWRQVAVVAGGGALALSEAAQSRILAAHALVEAIVHKGVRAYGVNTGVGALCEGQDVFDGFGPKITRKFEN